MARQVFYKTRFRTGRQRIDNGGDTLPLKKKTRGWNVIRDSSYPSRTSESFGPVNRNARSDEFY